MEIAVRVRLQPDRCCHWRRMAQHFLFPTQELRDAVMKGGLTPKGRSEFYQRLEKLLGELS